jgi:hypothetical protein
LAISTPHALPAATRLQISNKISQGAPGSQFCVSEISVGNPRKISEKIFLQKFFTSRIVRDWQAWESFQHPPGLKSPTKSAKDFLGGTKFPSEISGRIFGAKFFEKILFYLKNPNEDLFLS